MLTDIYASISAKMAARGCNPTVKIGIDKPSQNDDAPRVIFYPTEDSFEQPMNPGGNPRTIRDRISTTEVRIWGLTYDHVEELVNQVVLGIHLALKTGLDPKSPSRAGLYKLGKGTWVRDTADDVRGVEYVFTFAVREPVLDRYWTNTASPPDHAEDIAGKTYDAVPDGTEIDATVSETINGVQNQGAVLIKNVLS